jgi:hypothetical protein
MNNDVLVEQYVELSGKDREQAQLDIDAVLADYFADVDDSNPTGEGLTKREAQHLLIKEMNARIQNSNIKRVRKTGGRTPLAPAFSGIRQINQAVFMARQRGDYKELLKVAGY